ncbi:MAG: insulinase family protein [Thermoleophilia bacterium]|nr:insulinase family protein [Thermoleophilia bacterium]
MQTTVVSALDDGERVVTERLEGVRSVAIGFWIGVGARDETPAQAGVTHFLEHLLFKGTRSYSAREIAEVFDGLGGELNAATTREYTVVYARVLDEHLATALDVMSDLVFAPRLADLDAEREVVLEEIAMYEDTPQDLVHDLLSLAIFGAHPLGRPVLGRAEVISSVTRRTLAAYHRSRYVAGNLVVAAAGSLDHERLVGICQELAGKKSLPPGRPARARAPLVTPPPPGLVFQRKDTEQYHVCVGAPAISRSDPRRFTASILDSILGGSASSRLFQEIRERRGLAYSVYTFATLHADTGEIGVYVGTREENLATCLELVAREIADIASGGVRKAELARAKENLKGRIALAMESTSSRMNRLGKSVVTDSELLSLDRVVAEIEAVDVDGVAALAAALLSPERLSASGIGPVEQRFREAVERVAPAVEEREAA